MGVKSPVVLVACVLVSTGSSLAVAQPASATPTPPGTTVTINATASQDHYDPHVDGNLVAYSNISGNSDTIHYYDLNTNQDNPVPNDGTTQDFLSDVNAGRIAFTRVNAVSSDIALYDTTAATPTVQIIDDPMPSSKVFRQAAQIGGNTIAWEDYGVYGTGTADDIVAYNLVTGVATDLTSLAGVVNQAPAISPDGSVIAWEGACSSTTSCFIEDAVFEAGSWVVHQITTALNGVCSHPDTNGVVVVYSCNRNGTDAVYFQPVGGGSEQTITFNGSAVTPAIAGDFISFAGESPGASNHLIYVAELTGGANPIWDGNLYQITNDTNDAQLNDITVNASSVTVVWQVQQIAVYGFTFANPQQHTGLLILNSDGSITTLGNATSLGHVPPNHPGQLVAIAVAHGGTGYYVADNSGGIYAFGTAVYYGSPAGVTNIVAMAVTPDSGGYWLLDRNGNVYPYGDAMSFPSFHGRNFVSLAATPSGQGLWALNRAGNVATVGNAPFLGAPVGAIPRSRAVAIVPTPDGGGYWVAKRDGAVYHYGNAGALGDCLTVVNVCGSHPHAVAMAGTGFGGYWLVMATGLVAPFGAPSYTFPLAPAVAAATDP